MKSKTIIISSHNEKTNGRGILTLYEEDNLLKCKLRLYNVVSLSKYCKLGLYHNNEVFSANLLEKSGVYLSSFVGNFDMEKDFYTAIVDTSNNNEILLAGGTYAGYFFNNTAVFEHLEKENPDTNLLNITQKSPEFQASLLYPETHQNTPKPANNCEKVSTNCKLQTPFDKTENVSTNSTFDKCATCKYKEFFYANENAKGPFGDAQGDTICHSECSDSEIEESHNRSDTLSLGDPSTPLRVTAKGVDAPMTAPRATECAQGDNNSILSALVPQFKYVFENYPEDDLLNVLIPNSKFVKISENGEKFSLGAIYDNEEMRFICYAVFKTYNTPAPEELGEHYQWLPIDKEDPLSDGYYVVFQDTSDLKIVEM